MEPGPSRKTSPIFVVFRPSSMVNSTGTSITKLRPSPPREPRSLGRLAPPLAGGAEAFSKALGAGGRALASLMPRPSSIFVPTSNLDRQLASGDHRPADEFFHAGHAHPQGVAHRRIQSQDLARLQRQHPT